MPFCFHKVERKKKVWSYLVFHGRVHTIFLVPVRLPIPAYLLALSYFFLSLLSLSMLVGLRTKRTRLLLAWILINLLVICPEAGMVLFMAVYYWVSNYRMSQQVLENNLPNNSFKINSFYPNPYFLRENSIKQQKNPGFFLRKPSQKENTSFLQLKSIPCGVHNTKYKCITKVRREKVSTLQHYSCCRRLVFRVPWFMSKLFSQLNVRRLLTEWRASNI